MMYVYSVMFLFHNHNTFSITILIIGMQKINYCKKEKNCTSRELNPGWGDGNAPCYHYTTGAVTGLVGSDCSLHLCQLVINK